MLNSIEDTFLAPESSLARQMDEFFSQTPATQPRPDPVAQLQRAIEESCSQFQTHNVDFNDSLRDENSVLAQEDGQIVLAMRMSVVDEQQRVERERRERQRVERERQNLERQHEEARDVEMEQLQRAMQMSLIDKEETEALENEAEAELQSALNLSLQEEEKREREQLRRAQDRAYHDSLARDRQREAERERQIREIADETHREQLEREQEEFDAAILLSLKLQKAAQLNREPANEGEDSILISVRLADGSRVSRKFLADQTLQKVRDLIDAKTIDNAGAAPDGYVLVSDFPRRQYSDYDQSLKSLGFEKRALLSVHV